MTASIRIRCPVCHAESVVDRTRDDPDSAATLEVACELCAPFGPPSAAWFTSAGDLILKYVMEPDEPVAHGGPA